MHHENPVGIQALLAVLKDVDYRICTRIHKVPVPIAEDRKQNSVNVTILHNFLPVDHLFSCSLLLTRHHDQQSPLLVIFDIIFDPWHAQGPCWDKDKQTKKNKKLCQILLEGKSSYTYCDSVWTSYTSPDSTDNPPWAENCAFCRSGRDASSSSSAPPSPRECSHSGFSSAGTNQTALENLTDARLAVIKSH